MTVAPASHVDSQQRRGRTGRLCAGRYLRFGVPVEADYSKYQTDLYEYLYLKLTSRFVNDNEPVWMDRLVRILKNGVVPASAVDIYQYIWGLDVSQAWQDYVVQLKDDAPIGRIERLLEQDEGIIHRAIGWFKSRRQRNKEQHALIGNTQDSDLGLLVKAGNQEQVVQLIRDQLVPQDNSVIVEYSFMKYDELSSMIDNLYKQSFGSVCAIRFDIMKTQKNHPLFKYVMVAQTPRMIIDRIELCMQEIIAGHLACQKELVGVKLCGGLNDMDIDVTYGMNRLYLGKLIQDSQLQILHSKLPDFKDLRCTGAKQAKIDSLQYIRRDATFIRPSKSLYELSVYDILYWFKFLDHSWLRRQASYNCFWRVEGLDISFIHKVKEASPLQQEFARILKVTAKDCVLQNLDQDGTFLFITNCLLAESHDVRNLTMQFLDMYPIEYVMGKNVLIDSRQKLKCFLRWCKRDWKDQQVLHEILTSACTSDLVFSLLSGQVHFGVNNQAFSLKLKGAQALYDIDLLCTFPQKIVLVDTAQFINLIRKKAFDKIFSDRRQLTQIRQLISCLNGVLPLNHRFAVNDFFNSLQHSKDQFKALLTKLHEIYELIRMSGREVCKQMHRVLYEYIVTTKVINLLKPHTSVGGVIADFLLHQDQQDNFDTYLMIQVWFEQCRSAGVDLQMPVVNSLLKRISEQTLIYLDATMCIKLEANADLHGKFIEKQMSTAAEVFSLIKAISDLKDLQAVDLVGM